MKNLKLRIGALLFSAIFVLSCKQDDIKPQSIADLLNDNNDFSILNSAVKYAGYQDAYKTGTLTLFAPNDAAFKASGYVDVSAVTSLPIDKVRALLNYHLLPQKSASKNINDGDGQELKMFSKELAYLSKNSKGLSVNGVMVSTADLDASNGVVHVLERVIAPPTATLEQLAKQNPNLTLFLLAVAKAAASNPAIQTSLSSSSVFTVFAPNNKAMEAVGYNEAGIKNANGSLLATLLLYHVAQGRFFTTNLSTNTQLPVLGAPNRTITVVKSDATGAQVRGTGNGVNAANLTPPSLMATNGVLHVIDRVLLP